MHRPEAPEALARGAHGIRGDRLTRMAPREEDKRYRSHPGIHGYLHFITGANPERTIPKAIAELEKAGLLKVTRRLILRPAGAPAISTKSSKAPKRIRR